MHCVCNVCMCVYICMYVCMCVCLCMHMYVCMYVCVCVCLCMHVYMCMYVCMYVYMDKGMCLCFPYQWLTLAGMFEERQFVQIKVLLLGELAFIAVDCHTCLYVCVCVCVHSSLQVLDLTKVELVYSSSFFKSIETGGNVSKALVSTRALIYEFYHNFFL